MDVTRESLTSLFRDFRDVPAPALDEVIAASKALALARGTVIYRPGDACKGIGFVLQGEVRVFRLGETGREITLYEIFPGETCILNASCLLSGSDYPAMAETLTDVHAMMVPAESFLRLMEEQRAVRKFVLSLFSERLSAIMELVEAVAFGRLDRRLEDYLLEKSQDGVLRATHQVIANDLGTSREVVSRLLKDMEHRGKVRLSRSEITLHGLG